ncbi:MAG: hypothetical protein M3065_02450, partial [Actinomycetota bacterium]|nr:hypothetical protein [Actinomycetota bacterium]
MSPVDDGVVDGNALGTPEAASVVEGLSDTWYAHRHPDVPGEAAAAVEIGGWFGCQLATELRELEARGHRLCAGPRSAKHGEPTQRKSARGRQRMDRGV